ncbi:hypothetical protein Vadar_033196 [Vaccinium darrowii]|uniref:Uncharacterized protein n=1 Tax=Vaccinium darrowii TaxID=229202 RepID=A0ACB7YRW6_9ERIC|nr:hypothetical protein Vadar_033196 [Vaccinium darrowii]
MHHGGYLGGYKGADYIGGSVDFFDNCHTDEISKMDLCAMIADLGYTFLLRDVHFFVGKRGGVSEIDSDSDAMGLDSLTNGVGVVREYSVIELGNTHENTQSSQCLHNGPTSPPSKRTKASSPPSRRSKSSSPPSKRTKANGPVVATSNPPISGTTSKRAIFKKPPAKGKTQSVKTINPEPTKGKAHSKWTHEANSDGEGSSGEYDPESTSDSSDEDVFYDSDYGLTDDDRMFEENIDREVKENTNTHGAEYESVIEELADIDGDCASSDELPSYSTSSDSDDKPRRTRRKPDEKHPVFNEQSDMGNPVFIRGMEFKTHSLFRDAVKEYAIKHGKQIKFLKSDREKVRAVCKKGCPWEIYASYVPADALYRIKTYISQHTCTRTFDVPWVSSKWIVARYGNRIRSNPTWPVPSLAETIQQEWTVKVSIRKVYRAKNICLAMRDGTAIE